MENPKVTEWITATIAIVALAQPWVILLWKKYFRKKRIDIYLHSIVEVRFGSLGNLIGIRGGIRALPVQVFINQFDVVVRRKKDSALLKLEWFLKKEERLIAADAADPRNAKEETIMSLPTGFVIGPTQPAAISYLCCDVKVQPIWRDRFNAIRDEWSSFKLAKLDEAVKAGAKDDLNALSYKILGQFLAASKSWESLSQDMDREFFWFPGEYEIEVNAKAVELVEGHCKRQFKITAEDSKKLRANAFQAMCEAAELHYRYFTLNAQFDAPSN